MAITGKRKHRIRPHDSAEIGVGPVRDVGSGLEQPEDGEIDRERRPIEVAQDLQRHLAVDQCQRTLDDPGEGRSGRQLHDSG